MKSAEFSVWENGTAERLQLFSAYQAGRRSRGQRRFSM